MKTSTEPSFDDASGGSASVQTAVGVRSQEKTGLQPRRSAAPLGLPSVTIQYANDMKKPRFLLIASAVLFCLVLPLTYAGYLGFFASERYSTEFKVIVRAVDGGGAGGLGGLLGGVVGQSNPSSATNAQAISQYLTSANGVRDISKEIDLVELFAREDLDWTSRQDIRDGMERFLPYWKDRVTSVYEKSTDTLTVNVEAFSEESTLALAQALLDLADDFINRLSERSREETLRFARTEVEAARENFDESTLRFSRFVGEQGIFDPAETVKGIEASIQALEESLSEQNIELSILLNDLDPNSQIITKKRNAIRAVESEVARIREQLVTPLQTGTEGQTTRSVSSAVPEFSAIKRDQQLAEQAFTTAVVALQSARLEATRRQIYLAQIVSPGLPTESFYPKPVIALLQGVLVGCLFWLICVISAYAVREHV